jgi:pilus assembly protein Flp/PilA
MIKEEEKIMLNKIKNLVVEEQGQGMTEYGLVLGAIAIGVLGLLMLLSGKIKELIGNVTDGIQTEFAE